MADLEKRSIASLVNAVSALLDMSLTDTSTPTRSQVKVWLTDGAVQLFNLLPPEVLIDCVLKESFSGSTVVESSFNSSVCKVVAVNRAGVGCTKITEEEFSRINITPYLYTSMNPAYTVTKSSSLTVVSVYPKGKSIDIDVRYLPYPFSYAVPFNEESTVGGDNAVPAMLEPMIIDYATIMYRAQDEEPGQFQLYMGEWKEKIKLAYQIPSSNMDGS